MQTTAVLAACLALATPNPVPQDPNDDAEVFSGPVDRNQPDYDYDYGFVPRVRVLLLPVGGRGEEGGPSLAGLDGLLSILSSILASRRPYLATEAEETPQQEEEPGWISSFFQDSLAGARDHMDTVRDRENELDFDGSFDGLDINNSNHSEKVLEDGTVLHINRTTIADTDENGNSFYFHRAVIHSVGEEDKLEPGLEVGEPQVELEEKKEEEVEEGIDDGLIA